MISHVTAFVDAVVFFVVDSERIWPCLSPSRNVEGGAARWAHVTGLASLSGNYLL